MSIVLDVILVVIFAAFVLVAAKKGFVKTLLELVAVAAALVLAYQFSPVVAQGAYDGFVKESMITSIEEQIDENFDTSTAAKKAEVTLEALPDFMVSLASSAGVEINDIKAKIASEKFSSKNVATELVEKVAEPIVIGALTIVFFMILAIVLIFALKFVAHLVSKLFDVPLIGTANKILGGALGACKGVIVLLFLCTILDFLFAKGDGELSVAVNDSFVIGLLDNINPFINNLKEMLVK
ncbi:MAG: CvpA family protein [Clostridia bacterium]|nr:CvpA family protein [Clostridia bacterium]